MNFFERVREEARSLSPARALTNVLSAPLYALGWFAGKLVLILWIALAWSWTAAMLGFRDARGGRRE